MEAVGMIWDDHRHCSKDNGRQFANPRDRGIESQTRPPSTSGIVCRWTGQEMSVPCGNTTRDVLVSQVIKFRNKYTQDMVRRTQSERTVSNIVCDAENANSGEHLGLPASL